MQVTQVAAQYLHFHIQNNNTCLNVKGISNRNTENQLMVHGAYMIYSSKEFFYNYNIYY